MMPAIRVLVFILLTFFGGMAVMDKIVESLYGDIYELKKECEKDLPRTEHCKLIAIKESNNE